MGAGPHALGCSEDREALRQGTEWSWHWSSPPSPHGFGLTLHRGYQREEAQARVRTAAPVLFHSARGGEGLALCTHPPTPEGPQVTVALGRLAPDALRLADADVVGGARAIASVTRVEGHRAQPGAIEAQGGVCHLLGRAAVHLYKDTAALSCPVGCLPAPRAALPLAPPGCTAWGPRSPHSPSRGEGAVPSRMGFSEVSFPSFPSLPSAPCWALLCPSGRGGPPALSPAWHRRPVYPA